MGTLLIFHFQVQGQVAIALFFHRSSQGFNQHFGRFAHINGLQKWPFSRLQMTSSKKSKMLQSIIKVYGLVTKQTQGFKLKKHLGFFLVWEGHPMSPVLFLGKLLPPVMARVHGQSPPPEYLRPLTRKSFDTWCHSQPRQWHGGKGATHGGKITFAQIIEKS